MTVRNSNCQEKDLTRTSKFSIGFSRRRSFENCRSNATVVLLSSTYKVCQLRKIEVIVVRDSWFCISERLPHAGRPANLPHYSVPDWKIRSTEQTPFRLDSLDIFLAIPSGGKSFQLEGNHTRKGLFPPTDGATGTVISIEHDIPWSVFITTDYASHFWTKMVYPIVINARKSTRSKQSICCPSSPVSSWLHPLLHKDRWLSLFGCRGQRRLMVFRWRNWWNV